MNPTSKQRILVIDTSTNRGAVALVSAIGDAVSVIASEEFTTDRSHNSRIFEPLKSMLDAAGGASIDTILVGTGPGSYTGIRIGIAAANGLAVSLRSKTTGIPSILGLSPDCDDFHAVGDARRGQSFLWTVRNGVPVDSPSLMPVDVLTERLASRTEPTFTLDHIPQQTAVTHALPDTLLLARRFVKNRSLFETSSDPLEPVYLAAPFITQPKQRQTPPASLDENRSP